MKLKVVHLLAFFALTYIGVEVTIGGTHSSLVKCIRIIYTVIIGWIVKYILDERHGGPTSGYISSGFFAGLTLGRVGLLWFNKLVFINSISWDSKLLIYR